MNQTGTNEGGGQQQSSSAQATMQGFQNGGIYGAISAGAGSLLNRFPTPHEDLNKNTQFATNIRNSTSDVLLSSGNPYAMAAGAAVKLIDKTGGFTDASEGLGGTNDTLNTLASLTLPGAGWFTKPIEKYEVSAATKAMKNSYAGTLKDNQKAAKNSGAKILFGRNLATSKIHVGKANDRMIENIKQNSNDDYQTMATMTQSKAMEDQYAYTGGYQQALARAGKFGMKIERAKILAKIDFKPAEKVEGFKLGGVLDVKEFIDTTEQQNANFFASLTFDDLPKYQEGGSFEAKPTEDTSESKKNELAEEAGKLLWKEILYNTDDRTGLIDTLKKGGTLKAQEGIQVPDALSVKVPDQSFSIKHKPTYQEWIKTVNPDYINPNYDLETAYKYLPFEQMERWRFAVNQPTRKLQDYYLKYQDPKTGKFIYHTGFTARLPNGDYIFLKKGTEKTNPEVHWETDTYHDGTNGLKETHDLVYDTKEGRYFYRKKKAKKNEEGLETFKEGGQMNVIPEGNLHARLHHMEDSEKFTQKGIPVIDKDGNQQAEIELNEIIFNLEVTEKLEKMYKSYKDYESNKEKDEVAIQAGKLIAKEIMENTEDRTGLINQVQ